MIGLHTAILALALTGAGADEPVLLEFSAPWCGPCRQMDPVIEGLIAKGYPIKKLDFDRDRDMARKFGVDGIPCFIMTVGGRETARTSGLTPAGQIEAMFGEARALVRPKQLPGPTQAPLQLASNPPQSQPIPLPAQQAGAALAMETRPAPGVGRMVSLNQETRSAVQPAVAYGAGPTRNAVLTDSDLIAATVRLRVYDAHGPSCGTGTMIDSRGGRALILTCGHIFREYQEGGRIEVELFGASKGQTVPGRLLAFDDERDVGLLTIQVPGPVKTVRVAPRGYSVDVGKAVVSVGCNHGDDPTARRSQVTARNKYLGPPNIEVAGLPVQGRSGGGLFSTDGFVVGVCNAADPQDNEGLYAALASIHQQLDESNLGIVYGDEKPRRIDEAPMVAVAQPAMPEAMPEPNPIVQWTESRENASDGPVREGIANPLTSEEQRLLNELRRRREEGAEIICIIRTKESPDARSEVFVFENASPDLVERLNSEGFASR